MKESLDLVGLIDKFGDDQRCRNYLEGLRWHEGVRCPRCGSEKISSILKRDQFDCDSCRYQFSVTAGTIFHDTHLPLVKWFLATYMLCQSRKGMSANQLKRMLGISYKTAWYLCHRIRAAMSAAEEEQPKLHGTVEVDETYVGGKPRKGTGYHKHGRGTEKEIVIGIRQRGGDLRFFHADDVKSGTLAKYIKENVSEDVDVVMTDDFTAYPKAIKEAGVLGEHKAINHSLGQYSIGDLHTNTVESAFSLLKRGIIGTWHRVSAKHLPAYLDEMTWRFNNRQNPYLFRDTMKRMLNADNLEFKVLTAV
ncbi:MAG: IS1595 family transposase [Candidatus Korobacteraceae bacterium]|jgi:transposase-like protein